MSITKIATLGVWVVLLVLALGFTGTARQVGLYGLPLTAAAHCLEMLIFARVIRGGTGSLAGNLFQVLLFGLFHIWELHRQQQQPESL